MNSRTNLAPLSKIHVLTQTKMHHSVSSAFLIYGFEFYSFTKRATPVSPC